jgi:hypothetical protein
MRSLAYEALFGGRDDVVGGAEEAARDRPSRRRSRQLDEGAGRNRALGGAEHGGGLGRRVVRERRAEQDLLDLEIEVAGLAGIGTATNTVARSPAIADPGRSVASLTTVSPWSGANASM